jgi:hypothetical protein
MPQRAGLVKSGFKGAQLRRGRRRHGHLSLAAVRQQGEEISLASLEVAGIAGV